MEGISNEGVFEDSFRTNVLPGYLGDDHKGSKVMDDVPNVGTLIKRFADTKSAFDKKLENVIQKPGESATEDEKSAYRTALAVASGAPVTAAEYEFFKSEKLPEGMERNQTMEDRFRTEFFKHKAPKELVKALSQVFEELQIEGFNAMMAEDVKKQEEITATTQKVQDDKIDQLKKGGWTGDAAKVKPRVAFHALKKFNTGDPEFIKKLDESKVYDNPEDFAAWKKLGVSAADLERWSVIGEAMGVSVSPTDKSGGGGTGARVIDEIYKDAMD